MAFEISKFAKTLADVSKLDTSGGPEQIEYIAIGLIDDDPQNFYQLSGLDELASNIALLGLQQPLRVRPNPDDPQRVIIVSGHRRRAAIRTLIDEGRTDLTQIPCIREVPAQSAALQELRLIYANSGTRVLNSAELSRQAERVEELLYQLKEEGMDFPGRMRDHVAEACQVSKSKLARLKVIRENLIPEFARHYKANRLKETPAYTLAQQPADVQKLVWKYADTKHLEYLSERQITDMLGKIKPVLKRACRLKEGRPPCEHQSVLLAKIFDGTYSYKPCDSMCCDKCERLSSCKSACPLLAEKAKKLRTDKAAQNKQEMLARQERDRPEVEAISAFWEREAAARARAGKSVKALFTATETYYSAENEKLWLEREALQKIRRGDTLPFGLYGFSLGAARKLVATADFLGVTTDYLLGRTEAPVGPVDVSNPDTIPDGEPKEVFARRICWESQSRTPPEGKLIITYAPTNDGPVYRAVIFEDGQFKFPNKKKLATGLQYAKWLEVPPPDSGEAFQLEPPACAEGQLMLYGWMPGGTFPLDGSDVVADFRCGDDESAVIVRQLCTFSNQRFRLKNHSAIDAECIRWMALPPVGDDVSKSDTNGETL